MVFAKHARRSGAGVASLKPQNTSELRMAFNWKLQLRGKKEQVSK